MDGMLESWSRLAELWWSRHGGAPAEGLARGRLDLLLRYAREYSPYYRRAFEGLPADPPLEALPRTTKADLMAHFDDWATDRRITRAAVERFLDDRSRVGERFLDHYWAWKSSGTSGRQGLFVQDPEAMAVYDALVAAQLEEAPWNVDSAARSLAAGGRAALVVATGDHFASIASWQRMLRALPGLDARSFAVLDPLPRLVDQLNDWQPAFLAGYPSTLALLAQEQFARRLAIRPALAWCGGETLEPAARDAIEDAFGCGLMNEYGASECLSIAHECAHGWQHLHAEWVLLEGVDRDGLPVGPGEVSHTVLLTNLANWTQPVIRYDLGDRIVRSPGPCACGSALPAFKLQGRADDLLALRKRDGAVVRLAPLAITTVIEEAAGDHVFQVAQRAPDSLVLRFAPARNPAALLAARRNARDALHRWLATQALGHVHVLLDAHPPRRDTPSGKIRTVVVEAG